MNLVFCALCGEAYLQGSEKCPHCPLRSDGSSPRRMKIAIMLGFLSLGLASEAAADPEESEESSERAEEDDEQSGDEPLDEKETKEAKEKSGLGAEGSMISHSPQFDSVPQGDGSLVGKEGKAIPIREQPIQELSTIYGRPQMPLERVEEVQTQVRIQTVQTKSNDNSVATPILRKYLRHAEYVYESSLRAEEAEYGGQIKIEFQVVGGRVAYVFIRSNTTGSELVAKNLKQKVMRWRFPKDYADTIIVTYSLSIQE